MAERPIKVLLIDDDPAAAGQAEAALAQASPGFSVETCPTLSQGLARIPVFGPDIILLDLALPDSDGPGTFARVHEAAPDVPVVVLSGAVDQELSSAVLGQGAEDFLVKDPVYAHVLARVMLCALERKRAEVRGERLKDEFLHNVSHELKTPLAAVHQSVGLILDGVAGPATPLQHKFLEIADRNVRHLIAMIDDLLDVTRSETGKLTIEPRRTTLEPILDDVAGTSRMGAQAKGVELETEVAPGLPHVQADPVRVRQVLVNLIDNALKHTPKGGSVRVRVRPEAGGGVVEVSVSDTGRGMEPEVVRRIFERLYQAPGETEARRGLGLGLYICRQLVERHGGAIRADSEPGKGSVFAFTLPVFSLARLLEPLLVREGHVASHFALLCVEVWPAEQYLSGQFARGVLLAARSALKQGAHPEDVLLPEMSPSGKEGLLFIAACLHPKSVPSMSRRLEGVLGGAYPIKSHRLAPRISHQMVSLSAQGPEAVAEAADRVCELVLRAVEDRGMRTPSP